MLYTQLTDNIQEILQNASKMMEDDSLCERIDAARKRLRRDKMYVLVVGEFSRGKSTFINALLHAPVLPSKVNPTTATINLIIGGNNRMMKIVYRGGQEEEVSLPESEVNKFLDNYVTTANKQVSDIKTIQITWPGSLENWNCTIVDTPGVNDLDAMREEITFNYISQADACVVILDSQQPLSESERRFLNDKVLAKDVSRLFFIINRMDEIPRPNSNPDIAITNRIVGYVRNRLKENLPILDELNVNAVASKPALRARFKNEANPWVSVFEKMEDALVNFININATKKRFPNHLDTALQILRDGLTTFYERKQFLSISGEELSKQTSHLRQREKQIQVYMQLLETELNKEKLNLSSQLNQSLRNGFTKLKRNLNKLAEQCQSDEDIADLKSSTSRGIRDVMESVHECIYGYRERISIQMDKYSSELFASKDMSPHPEVLFTVRKTIQSNIVELDAFSNKEISEYDLPTLGTSIVAGGAIGYAGAVLFGPIGIAVAIVGAGYFGKKLEENRMNREWEKIRIQTISNIRNQIDSLLSDNQNNATRIAEQESKQIEGVFRDRFESRLSTMRKTLDENHDRLLTQGRDMESELQRYNDATQKLENLLTEIKEIQETYLCNI